jgi:hypothetical protein
VDVSIQFVDGPVHAESIRTNRVPSGRMVLVDRVVAVRVRLLERLRRGLSTNNKHIASDRRTNERTEHLRISPRDSVINQESIQLFGASPLAWHGSITPNGPVPKFRINCSLLFDEELVGSCVQFALYTSGIVELPSFNKILLLSPMSEKE